MPAPFITSIHPYIPGLPFHSLYPPAHLAASSNSHRTLQDPLPIPEIPHLIPHRHPRPRGTSFKVPKSCSFPLSSSFLSILVASRLLLFFQQPLEVPGSSIDTTE